MKKLITLKEIDAFKENLILEEMSEATVEKYVRDVKMFAAYVSGEAINKEIVIAYKKNLQEKYAVRSVNSMLAGINQFFEFKEWYDLKNI